MYNCIVQFRERQKVDQLKEDAASWKKDKREDAIAREKIMAQISQDRFLIYTIEI